jgi:hypothetical protein
MTEKNRQRRRDRPNAFERASDAVLALDTGWWTSLVGAGISELDFSDPEYLALGNETTSVGGMILERRTLTYKIDGDADPETVIITRPVMTRFSALPIDLLERLARDILEHADAEWRQANIENVIAVAQSFGEEERLDIARDVLGADASEEEIRAFADQLQMPEELLQGGEAAAKFFDDSISSVAVVGEEGEERLADEPAPPPGRTALLTGEWDYYTPEEVEDYGGPESDRAYAFRIVRLCEAIRADPQVSVQLAVHLGAVTREWEMWRENEEFITAGRAHFAQQSRLARSRSERPWMTQVRQDLAEGRIGVNVAHYAREFKRRRRNLLPPEVDRIRNFVSELRKAKDE